MKIIAFGHKSHVGKSTAASFLQTILRTKGISCANVSFASKLKKVCRELWGWAGVEDEQYYEDHRQKRDVVLPALGMTVVRLWNKFGTDMTRGMIHDATWVNATLLTKRACDVLVISDCRFQVEAAAIKELGGLICRISNSHAAIQTEAPADNALNNYSDWDHVIPNESTLQSFYQDMERFAKKVGLLHG